MFIGQCIPFLLVLAKAQPAVTTAALEQSPAVQELFTSNLKLGLPSARQAAKQLLVQLYEQVSCLALILLQNIYVQAWSSGCWAALRPCTLFCGLVILPETSHITAASSPLMMSRPLKDVTQLQLFSFANHMKLKVRQPKHHLGLAYLAHRVQTCAPSCKHYCLCQKLTTVLLQPPIFGSGEGL